jgi:hypothetical protein
VRTHLAAASGGPQPAVGSSGGNGKANVGPVAVGAIAPQPDFPGVPAAHVALLRAMAGVDLHGCELHIERCAPVPRLVGVRGIVCRVTHNTLHLVDSSDRLHGTCVHRPPACVVE